MLRTNPVWFVLALLPMQVCAQLPGLSGSGAATAPLDHPQPFGSVELLDPQTDSGRQTANSSKPENPIRQTQFLNITNAAASGNTPQISAFRRLSLNSRGDTNINISFEAFPNDPSRGILVLTGGLNLIIEGVNAPQATALNIGDTIDLSADNAVVWMLNPSKLNTSSAHQESDANDLEIYLEGNIVFRNGQRCIEANKMYYDVKNRVGYVLDGKMTAPIEGVKNIEGAVRLKAGILRQLADGLFTAQNTVVSTSQLGEPAYSLHSGTLLLKMDDAGNKGILTAENNTINIGAIPVFYYPWISTNIEDPTFYIKRISYGNSSDKGYTIRTLWNPFQILNCKRKPDWLDGDFNLTWMSKRGIGYGGFLEYEPPSFCHIPGATKGQIEFFGLDDSGLDRLGGKRNAVGYPHDYRYRLHWIHEQKVELSTPVEALNTPVDVRAEFGKTSDRNYINSYFNSIWNTEDNATTAIDVKKTIGAQSCTLSAEYALDGFYSNANWYPRFDHFLLGQQFFRDIFTYYEHSRIGIADFNRAEQPFDPIDAAYFRYLPWETDTAKTGLVFSTRHEVDMPVSLGALRVVPYVLGDFSAWQSDQSGHSAERLYGQGGVRLSLPLYKVRPEISHRGLYLSGLAHKVDFDAEYLYAQSNRDMSQLLMTDSLDNWSIEDFRRRYVLTNKYYRDNNAYIPTPFDPRYYALRSGIASNVSAGNMDIADDLQMLRAGITQRWQTKRGSVSNRHIIDWITLGVHANFYPQSEQNYGKSIGLLDYDFNWNVGDRVSLFSEGLYDFFDSGQQVTRIGTMWNRPDRGRIRISLDQFNGTVERTYLTQQIGYTMNEKYSIAYSTSYDLRNHWRNVGHNFQFIRTGESFRTFVGAVYSEALSQWSFSLGIEPVFMRTNKSKSRY